MARKRKGYFFPAATERSLLSDSAGDSSAPNDAGPAMIGVSELVARIKSALAEALPERFCVVGEISNLSLPASGHLYFSLKDSRAAIAAAMWRSQAERLKFRPVDGLEVVAEGRVDVYDAQGRLQLYVERMTPRGQGALELAFRQLKEKLQAEGLFDPSRKKPIVRFPRAIGVITSATGAAIRDVQRTLRRRWPAAEVYLLPVPVQGEGAAEQIAQAVRLLDAQADRLGIDTILLVRGGGSLEDLWAFNEEVLARAVFAARTPIVSGVGHEVDVTICDLVADMRAATPTAAAELAVPDREELRRHLLQQQTRLRRSLQEKTAAARRMLEGLLRSAAFRDPLGQVRNGAQRVDELSHRLRAALHGRLAGAARQLQPAAHRLAAVHPSRLLERAAGRLDRQFARLRWALGGRSKRAGDRLAEIRQRMEKAHPVHRLSLARQRLEAMGRQLEAMSYRNVLRRGFSVTRAENGRLLRSVADAQPGRRVRTELADGEFQSEICAANGTISRTAAEAARGRTRRRKPLPPPAGPLLFE